MACENMGDIAYQSIAGAIATATHGIGWHFGNISSRIVGVRLIAGDGSVIDCSATENPELLAAAKVGLGAMGILSSVTIHAVRAFRLHAIEEAMRIDEVLGDFDRSEEHKYEIQSLMRISYAGLPLNAKYTYNTSIT